jgi:hypothetical protein
MDKGQYVKECVLHVPQKLDETDTVWNCDDKHRVISMESEDASKVIDLARLEMKALPVDHGIPE